MKKYFEYMDGRTVSDTLHQRLLNLEAPKKQPAWKKYGAAAAALAIVVGVGVWALDQSRPIHSLVDEVYVPIDTLPEIADEPIPDIGDERPGLREPGMETLGGYEITDGEMTSYYLLPYIVYGMTKNVAQMSLDWDLPKGSTRRDLTQADIAALFGGAENLSALLAWGDYELTGWAAWYEDGSFWGLFVNGYMGPMDHFELALTAGNTYPPSCIGYLGGVEQDIWGLSVTAYGHNGEHGCDRRVEFLNDGFGIRFDITGSDVEQTSLIVSRLVRWVAAEGLETDGLSSDGAALAHPWEDPNYVDPDFSVGEPDWEN